MTPLVLLLSVTQVSLGSRKLRGAVQKVTDWVRMELIVEHCDLLFLGTPGSMAACASDGPVLPHHHQLASFWLQGMKHYKVNAKCPR